MKFKRRRALLLVLSSETGSGATPRRKQHERRTCSPSRIAETESLMDVNKTYINLTQPSIARQAKTQNRLDRKSNLISQKLHISHFERDLAINWTLKGKAIGGDWGP